MYKAIEVAQYIIEYSKKKDTHLSLSGLKLQKLLYFVQVSFLLEKGKPCFKDNLLSYDFGSVVKDVFDIYKCNQFLGQSSYLKDGELIYYNPNTINELDKKMIRDVVDFFESWGNYSLTELIQDQDPWIEGYSLESKIISNQSIIEFFS